MITFYSGTPGSGKSLQMAHQVEFTLRTLKKNVIANVNINRKEIMRGRRNGGTFYHISNDYMTPDFFYKYALKFHKFGVEGQTLVVIDEAQFLFSPTACKLFTQKNPKYRQDWLEFFSTHRHLGYDFILISQFDKLIDAQIRCLFEFNYIHRKANNFRVFGQLLTIFHIKLFIQVQYWYGCKEKSGQKYFVFRKRYSKIYDSYAYRNQIILQLNKKYGSDFVEQLMDPSRRTKKKQ